MIDAKRKLAVEWRKIALAAAVLIVLAGGGFLGWNYYQERDSEAALAAFEKDAAFPLPKKPSIAVLAFENMSGDADQEYFSDGMSETIITQLSRLPDLFVISRTSSFSFKGRPVTVRQVGKELGVQYVLEGSVQKADKRVRITAQLIDAASGKHIWAERYDRELKGIFSLQDEIVRKIVTALEVNLTMDKAAQVRFRSTDSSEAWNHYLRGLALLRGPTKAEWDAARPEFRKALKLDPEFEAALLGLGWSYYLLVRWGWGKTQNRDRVAELAARALSLNAGLAEPYILLGAVELTKRNFDQAINHMKRGVALEPGVAKWQMHLASALSYAGSAKEALAVIKQALRLNPFPTDDHLTALCRILYQNGRYEEAIDRASELVNRNPYWKEAHIILMAAYSAVGRYDDARAEYEKYKAVQRDFTSPKAEITYRTHFSTEGARRIFADLAKAGLPE